MANWLIEIVTEVTRDPHLEILLEHSVDTFDIVIAWAHNIKCAAHQPQSRFSNCNQFEKKCVCYP